MRRPGRGSALPLLALLGAGLAGCGPDVITVEVPTPLPSPWALDERVEPPDARTWFWTGEAVALPDWGARRSELLRLFSHYVYGSPARPVAPRWELLDETAPRGERLLHGEVGGWPVALFLPAGDGPFPVLLALNKCGNPSVSFAATEPTEAWNPSSCSPVEGFRADAWSVFETLDRGWGVATVHQNAIAEDRQELDGGLAIARWADALVAIAEALEDVDAVGPVVTAGHSRRGKAALLAAARSESIAAAVGHQSGTAGAALSRHLAGEPIESITGIFPHWLHPDFATFAGRETFLPVDQHLLLAAIAPRPVLVTDGADDAWADPEGARQAVELAAEVYDWLGAPGAVEQLVRPGDHALTAADWTTWIDWLEPRL